MWPFSNTHSAASSRAGEPAPLAERLVVWLTSFSSSAQISQAATIPTDTVVPAHSRDDTPQNRSRVLDFTLRYDEVLDVEKMRQALARLMELEGWRKLGARLRLDNNGKLEYHIPSSFTDERPAFRFSHVQHSNSIDQDTLASQLPKATTVPSIHPDPLRFNNLARDSRTPRKLDDYISSDLPQLTIHIVSFTDATLVTISWVHTFSDAMGISSIFDAWIFVLEGKEDQVPSFTGFASDPLSTFGSPPSPVSECTEKLKLAGVHIKGFHAILYGLRYLSELFFYPEEEDRIVCIPAGTIASLRTKAIRELATPSNPTPFLSEGDVLSGWWTRTVLRQMPWSWNRSIVILNLFCLRRTLSSSLLPSQNSYVSNAVGTVYALFPSGLDVLSQHLGTTASAVRSSIASQGTLGQQTALAKVNRSGIPVFGYSSDLVQIAFTNWTKCGFFEKDFSSAVVGGRGLGKGKVSYVHVGRHLSSYTARNSFVVLGKDGDGNYWLTGRLRKGIWGRIENTLACGEM